MDCIEHIGEEQVPSTHVITVEMPFEPLVWDQLTETTASGSQENDGDDSSDADTPEASGAQEESSASPAARDTPTSEKAGKGDSKAAGGQGTQEDELDLPPAGVFKGENGLPMAVAADGRPVGVMSMGPVAPVSGWRLVDINGHQPVTASEYDFVSAMLSRRGSLFPEGDDADSEAGDDSADKSNDKSDDKADYAEKR